MTDKTQQKSKDNNMDRFMLDASSIVILKKGDGKKPKCDPKDASCKVE